MGKTPERSGTWSAVFSRSARKAFTRHIDTLWRIRPNVSKIETIFREGGFDTLYMNNQPGSNEEGYLAGANLHARIIQHCRIEPVLTPPLVKLVNTHATKSSPSRTALNVCYFSMASGQRCVPRSTMPSTSTSLCPTDARCASA